MKKILLKKQRPFIEKKFTNEKSFENFESGKIYAAFDKNILNKENQVKKMQGYTS